MHLQHEAPQKKISNTKKTHDPLPHSLTNYTKIYV